MEKLIIIACVALVLGIIAFGAYQLRKLRNRWADLKNANVHGKDADRIVYAYRVEEGYVRQRSCIWLLTIMASAVVILLSFGFVYCLHHKDVLAVAGSEMMEKFSSALQSKFEKKELVKEQKNTSELQNRRKLTEDQTKIIKAGESEAKDKEAEGHSVINLVWKILLILGVVIVCFPCE